MNEEEQKEKQITDARAHQASKDVLSTSAKAAGTYFGGSVGGKAVDAISKTEVGDKILDSAASTANSVIPEPLKKGMADNQEKISSASKIADKLSTAEPEALNTDNSGYNPYLGRFASAPTRVNSSLNPNNISSEPPVTEENPTSNPNNNTQDVEEKTSSNEEEKNLSEKHSKKNNINDEAKGDVKIPPVVLTFLPIMGILLFLILFVLVLFYNQINDEENAEYEYSNLPTCSRIIFNEDLENLKEELANIDLKIEEAIKNNDLETQNELIEERYSLIPSISLDDYIAWLLEKEVGEFENVALYYDFAIAIRTYLFNNSNIENNFCYIDESQSTKNTELGTKFSDYIAPTNEDIITIVKNTHNYVLVAKDQYVDTNIDAFCENHTDNEFYYLEERNQALDKKWVDTNVSVKNIEEECINNNGITMSKYGAYYLATVKDYGWKDILAYYYSGNLEIKLVNIIDMDEKGNTIYLGEMVGSADLPTGASGFAWPVTGMDAPNTCSRGIGVNNHYGMDIVRGQGTPVYASASGTVVGVGIVGTNGLHWSYGNGVKIKTDNNYMTIYAHFDQPPFVTMNQRVEQGQQIGVVGTTGNSTGYHLHFEVHDPKGNLVDPFTILNGLPACCGRGRMCSY